MKKRQVNIKIWQMMTWMCYHIEGFLLLQNYRSFWAFDKLKIKIWSIKKLTKIIAVCWKVWWHISAITRQIFIWTCQLFMSTCQINMLTWQKRIMATTSLISCRKGVNVRKRITASCCCVIPQNNKIKFVISSNEIAYNVKIMLTYTKR